LKQGSAAREMVKFKPAAQASSSGANRRIAVPSGGPQWSERVNQRITPRETERQTERQTRQTGLASTFITRVRYTRRSGAMPVKAQPRL